MAKQENGKKSAGSNTPAKPVTRAARKGPRIAKSVGSFVPNLTKKACEKYGFSTAALFSDWSQIAGNDLARFTAPERLRWPRNVASYGAVETGEEGRPGATLTLRVDPARALEIQYATAQLIERINGYFGYRAVTQIRIVQAPLNLSGPQATSRPADVVQQRTTRTRGPNAPQIELSGIKDDGLRDALARLAGAFA